MPSYETDYGTEMIKLPEPRYDSETSVEESLLKRRSVRDYSGEPLTLSEISQLLWAIQGTTNKEMGFRTAPSAGALYPLEVYVVAGNVDGLPDGIYRYKTREHGLEGVVEGDKRTELYNAALEQSAVKDAAAVMVLSAVYERVTVKYGEKGKMYAHIEAGHAAQNAYLQAVSLNLGMVVMGGFIDDEVKKVVKMPEDEVPLYLIPVGKK
jgi:SagB-type dehydrogenase family enzyme